MALKHSAVVLPAYLCAKGRAPVHDNKARMKGLALGAALTTQTPLFSSCTPAARTRWEHKITQKRAVQTHTHTLAAFRKKLVGEK